MVSLSRRVKSVVPSATIVIASKARALRARGVDVVTFATGEPDFDTPEHVRAAAIRAMNEGATHYPPLTGLPELKAAIAARVRADQGLEYGPEEILVTVGAKQGVFDACQALLDEGDEVLIPAPYWVSYPAIVGLAGGGPVFVPGDPARGFVPRADTIERRIGPRTRLLLLNSPSNPSGVCIPRDALVAIADMLRRHPGLAVVSDDVYEKLVYDGHVFTNLLQVAPDLRERVVTVSGVSKAYAMTGWRLGWSLGPPAIIAAMARIQGQSTSGAATFAQHGAVAALEGDQTPVAAMVAEYARRRARMVERLDAIPGIACRPPGGALYAFADVRGLLGRRLGAEVAHDDVRLAELLLDSQGVAVVPGSPFGGEGFWRLSFATSMDLIERGIDRIEAFAAALE